MSLDHRSSWKYRIFFIVNGPRLDYNANFILKKSYVTNRNHTCACQIAEFQISIVTAKIRNFQNLFRLEPYDACKKSSPVSYYIFLKCISGEILYSYPHVYNFCMPKKWCQSSALSPNLFALLLGIKMWLP